MRQIGLDYLLDLNVFRICWSAAWRVADLAASDPARVPAHLILQLSILAMAAILAILSVLVQILLRNIILWEFPSPHLALVGVGSILHAAHGLGFGILPFFQQFFYAL